VADPGSLGPVDPPSLLAVDPPDHTRLRKLVSREFTKRSVSRMTEQVTEVATGLLDRIEASGAGEFDLVEEYAAQLPVAVIADMLGVPAELHGQLLEWGNRAAVTLDPGLSWREFREAEDALDKMHAWFDAHVRTLRRTTASAPAWRGSRARSRCAPSTSGSRACPWRGRRPVAVLACCAASSNSRSARTRGSPRPAEPVWSPRHRAGVRR
jgi:cytochrome P450